MTTATITTFEYPDYKGTIGTIKVVGTIVTSCPDRAIYLTQLRDDTFHVYYGYQLDISNTLSDALKDFSDCMLHSFACD